MSRSLLLLLVAAACLLAPAVQAADTRYVTDQLIITLRDAAAANAKVLTSLRTGSAVDVLQEQGRFLKVRIDDGREGYVLAQYITRDTPKTAIIARLEKTVGELKARQAALVKDKQALSSSQSSQGARMRELQQQHDQLAAELARSQAALKEQTARYQSLAASAKNVVQTVKERDELKTVNARLTAELGKLRGENTQMLRTGMIRWFLAGAGVFFFGWLAGKISRRKRRSF
ncbi:MAG TPA: TIGR04211 family SH3 domain-containing protein [Desulfuromonadales bacterium]|nr:TIGR04211 family SH3 domain-containing protein [Desulfuromonadales bacterium]